MATKLITHSSPGHRRPFVGNHAETAPNTYRKTCGMHRANPKRGNRLHLKRILWFRCLPGLPRGLDGEPKQCGEERERS